MNFEEIILRQEITTRGGGIEITLDTLGHEGEKMTAYQNYLGGGMLGKVTNDCTVENWQENKKLIEIGQELRKYFHSLTNPEEGFESTSFEQNQKMPIAGY
ncbi:MAG: hypothetical protein R6U15_01750 [Candidatus Izemoplasmatales bacterium]